MAAACDARIAASGSLATGQPSSVATIGGLASRRERLRARGRDARRALRARDAARRSGIKSGCESPARGGLHSLT